VVEPVAFTQAWVHVKLLVMAVMAVDRGKGCLAGGRWHRPTRFLHVSAHHNVEFNTIISCLQRQRRRTAACAQAGGVSAEREGAEMAHNAATDDDAEIARLLVSRAV
jgi:hypothetical protein